MYCGTYQKVQGVEDLEISLRSAAQIGAGRTGKAVATAWLSSRPQVRPQGPPHPRGQLLRAGQVVDRQGGTEIQRRISLWPETLRALRLAIDARPKPADPNESDLVFLTVQGHRWVHAVPSGKSDGRWTTRNTLADRFRKLLGRLVINGRKRLGFYALRHCFETEAGESRDQAVVNAVMGHVDNSMAAHYRERMSNQRLRAVVDHVHRWLFEGTDDVS